MNNSERIASYISFIFHPLLMPLYGVVIIFYSDTAESLLPVEFRKYIYLLVFGGTCILPLLLLPLYSYWKTINSPFMNSAGERNTPLMVTFLFYLLTTYYLLRLPGHYIGLTIFFIAGCTICVIINFLINLKWKISSHLIGIGGIIGLVCVMRLHHHTTPIIFLVAAIMAGGILIWARMFLNAHSWKQLLAGLGAGAVTIFAVIFILNRLWIL